MFMCVYDMFYHVHSKRDPDRITPWKAGDLILTYESQGRVYELYNDWQFMYPLAPFNVV